MNATAKIGRWVSLFALAATTCVGAGAQALDDKALVWIENQSFGFESCAALSTVPNAEDAGATLSLLRTVAAGELTQAVRQAGVVLGGLQQLTMTPLHGSFACGARASEATFRIAAVDRTNGKFWSNDMTVRIGEAPADAAEVAELADLAADLARAFRGVVVAQSTLR